MHFVATAPLTWIATFLFPNKPVADAESGPTAHRATPVPGSPKGNIQKRTHFLLTDCMDHYTRAPPIRYARTTGAPIRPPETG